jgi:stearoyl-CoA desaturase (delta-9 desaturase)
VQGAGQHSSNGSGRATEAGSADSSPRHTSNPTDDQPTFDLTRHAQAPGRRIRPLSVLPYLSIHLICLGVIWVGWSWSAVAACVALFFGRMFIITAFYHRYFSHRTFRTSRAVQFLAAFIGTTTAQRGPIWWAAHHRNHHRHSDHPPDVHSPGLWGLLWSHMGWFLSDDGLKTDWKQVPDWAKVPELVWLERWHLIGPLALAGGSFALGAALQTWFPALGTNGPQMFVWCFGLSTTLLYHGTFTINSLAHTIGRRRFATTDDSRNSMLLSLLTLGEGWHNNHHHYPGTVRQGFYWWEFDPTYYALRLMQIAGLVWDLRPVPARIYEDAKAHRPNVRKESARLRRLRKQSRRALHAKTRPLPDQAAIP